MIDNKFSPEILEFLKNLSELETGVLNKNHITFGTNKLTFSGIYEEVINKTPFGELMYDYFESKYKSDPEIFNPNYKGNLHDSIIFK